MINQLISIIVGVALAQNQPPTIGGRYFYPECLYTADAAQSAGASCVLQAINHYITLLLAAIAVGSFAFLLYGSIQYITSFGDETRISAAKKTITNSLVGLAISGLSWLMVLGLASSLGVNVDIGR